MLFVKTKKSFDKKLTLTIKNLITFKNFFSAKYQLLNSFKTTSYTFRFFSKNNLLCFKGTLPVFIFLYRLVHNVKSFKYVYVKKFSVNYVQILRLL